MSHMKLMKRKKLKIILLVFLLLCIALALFCFIENRMITVSEYSLDAGLENNLKIVQLSDLHNEEFGEDNERLLEKVKEQNPDLIFLTGDFINRQDEDIEVAAELMPELVKIAPVYACLGNHEYTWNENFADKDANISKLYTDNGVTLLDDSYEDITVKGVKLRIGGYMGYYGFPGMFYSDQDMVDKEYAFFDDFENTDRYKILLNHIPTSWVDWDHYNDYDVDLVFSGHYHGGQIRIPGIGGVVAPYVGLFPKYTKGMYKGKKATCIISSGLGNEIIVPRINNPPEIVVLNLK